MQKWSRTVVSPRHPLIMVPAPHCYCNETIRVHAEWPANNKPGTSAHKWDEGHSSTISKAHKALAKHTDIGSFVYLWYSADIVQGLSF